MEASFKGTFSKHTPSRPSFTSFHSLNMWLIVFFCLPSFGTRLFLLGLEKYGKGDWRSISRNFVVTRTPTQVASHAQKFFIRRNSMPKEKRRSSIHDITSFNNGGDSHIAGPSQQPSTAPVSSKPNHISTNG